MTKARTVGQKRRGRPKKDGDREPNGRLARPQSETTKAQQEAIMSVALSARARQGVPPDMLKLPWMGCVAGRAIAAEQDVADLWDTITDIRSRRRAWLRTIGQDDCAAISSIKPKSEHPEDSDAPPPLDLRSDADRAMVAEARWNAIAAALYAIDPLAVRYIVDHVCRDEPLLRSHFHLPDILRRVQKTISLT